MANDVIIRVRVRQDTRDGFAAVTKDAEARGQEAAEKFSGRFGTAMGRLAQVIQEPLRRAGQKIGESLGEHGGQSFVSRLSTSLASATSKLQEIGRNIGERIGQSASSRISEEIRDGITRGADGRLRDAGGRFVSGARSGGAGGKGGEGGKGGDANVDVDRQSILQRLLALGGDAASSFWAGFTSTLSTIFNPTVLLAALGIAGLGYLIAPPLASAIVSGVLLALGGGVIALGVVAAFKDPRIQAAGTELKERLGKLFAEFGKPFRGPVENFLTGKGGDGGLLALIEKFTPKFAQLAEKLAPVADRLGDGILGMLDKMMPGLIAGIEGAAPIVDTLSKRLPDIGEAFGKFFEILGENGDEAAVFFDDLLSFLAKLIVWIARVIGFFARMYAGVKNFVTDAKTLTLEFAQIVIDWFGRILDAAALAFGWIPGLGGKLAGAKAAFADARKNINKELALIKDKTVTIRMRTFGLAAANAAVGVASTLAALGYASGGITGMLPQIGRAASGGIRNGLTLVGERGPELIDAAPGSRVSSNEDTRRMLSAGPGQGGEEWVEARWVGSGNAMIDSIMGGIQLRVVRQFSGNVQLAMGRGSA